MNKLFSWLTCGCTFICLVCCTNKEDEHLFTLLPSNKTNLTFINKISENKEFNILEYLYFYNGGGVACGDINNDGLVDIYFSSNQEPNRLYLNRGQFKFEDISKTSRTEGKGNWKTGITMADVNGDGYLDIFSCGVGNYKNFNSENQLLINNGDLTFSDKTNEVGLFFKGFSTQAVFFDYDLDGDLDCYLLNHSVHSASSYVSVSNRIKSDSLSGDIFYRNDLILQGKNTGVLKFTNVTDKVGILSSRLGYGLGVAVSDVNLDGYPDVYVSNDFQENDYLYLNKKNGTFNQVLEASVAHSSRFSMGNYIADVNNDLRPDVFTSDMLPQDEAVIKTSAGEDPYEVFKYKLSFGYHYQVARNCLQLNRFISDSSVVFTDIAQLAGVEATDWSWSPLLVDFDNDGLKDIFVSNGILRRPNDLDYINFISNQAIQDSLKTIEDSDLGVLDQMPAGKTSNFFFKNMSGIRFEDFSAKWSDNRTSFSNGSAFADLDNDGDFDIVVNNLNEAAFIYRNNTNEKSNRISIRLNGIGANKFGVGTKIISFSNGLAQLFEVLPTRGFCSSSDTKVIVGLGKRKLIDSLLVIWPDNTFQKKINIASGTSLLLSQQEHEGRFNFVRLMPKKKLLEAMPTDQVPQYRHQEDEFNAFNNEGLIPHMLTTQGPPLCNADINGDGLSDVFIGGGVNQAGAIFVQTTGGKWLQKKCLDFAFDAASEDVAAAFLDMDGDRDMDLAVAGGGQNPTLPPQQLMLRLYENDGKGNFKKVLENAPNLALNASTLKPCDYDQDGDVDIFLGANVIPFLYGMSPVSYLLSNDGKGRFSVVNNWLGSSQFDNPTQVRPGMVKDAVWSDINLDGRPDLILVGEWMPITILIQNANHQFENQTRQYGLELSSGLWNTISSIDFDKDGDMDFVAGNLGLNSRLTASVEKPLLMYLGDFDSNGGSDHILVYFNGDKSYPFASRDQLVKQLPGLKKKFLRYMDYRNVGLEDIVTPQQKGNSALMKVQTLSSVVLRNERTKLTMSALPLEAQLAPIYSIAVADINSDGNDDLCIGGNLNAVQPDIGRHDGSVGLVLLGDAKGNWDALDAQKSGMMISGEARHIEIFNDNYGRKTILVSRNNQAIIGFKTQ